MLKGNEPYHFKTVQRRLLSFIYGGLSPTHIFLCNDGNCQNDPLRNGNKTHFDGDGVATRTCKATPEKAKRANHLETLMISLKSSILEPRVLSNQRLAESDLWDPGLGYHSPFSLGIQRKYPSLYTWIRPGVFATQDSLRLGFGTALFLTA